MKTAQKSNKTPTIKCNGNAMQCCGKLECSNIHLNVKILTHTDNSYEHTNHFPYRNLISHLPSQR